MKRIASTIWPGARVLIMLMVIVVCPSGTSPIEMVSISPIGGLDSEQRANAASSIPAFPGAEGFGANSVGGRGGRVIEVTNLNDSGAGSLRAAINASGPRTVVFRVAGVITLESVLEITNPYITIAGQTAPGGGITLAGERLYPSTHNVVIRYLRWRGGAISFLTVRPWNDLHDVVVDHCSAIWGEDDIIDVWRTIGDYTDMTNVTIQRCLIAEPLAVHPTAMMVGAKWEDGVDAIEHLHNISIHHNLFVHSDHRNPRIKAQYTEVINNVVYNWGNRIGGTERASQVDWIGNYFKAGPMTSIASDGLLRHQSTDPYNWLIVYPPASLYVVGNIAPERGYSDANADNWGMYREHYGPNKGQIISETHRRYTPLHPGPFPVTVQSAYDIYDGVLSDVGANARLDSRGNWVANPDVNDMRLVSDVHNGTGPSHYTDIAGPGAIGPIDPGTPYDDTDHDGMADKWELLHFGALDRGSANNTSSDCDFDGYTDLEEFLNGTDPRNGLSTCVVVKSVFLPIATK